jgi:hypothetical protein
MPAEKDNGVPANPISEKDPRGFTESFPTETRGDGLIRPNNARTGAAQGKGGWKKKVRCQQCGFLMDVNKVDYSGGSLDGQGAAGAVTISADVGTLSNGGTTDDGMTNDVGEANTHKVGEQAYKKNAGCPFCFSKNGSKSKNVTFAPTPRPKVGF